MQVVVNLAGFALMIGTAALLSWYKTASVKRPSGASIPAMPSE
jgi:hypothetical protein